ncbi:SdpI family protein [Gorillibacterium sp. sgz5001074]|uniref:SdpI family protein n=1 Tax=Gorillibacterium sp. sgz5001074 TaxID=3446695 RepID=UPI003F666DF8
MKWNRTDLIMILIGLLPAAAAVLLYRELPERMGTHFSSSGVDRTMERPWAILMLALLGAGLPILTKATRGFDPRKEAFAYFERAYRIFRWAVTLFISFTGLFMVAYNLGYQVSPQWVSSLGMGLLLMVLGNYMGQIRFNYTFGIRTPWTLANETVWRGTHRMAAPIWTAAGAVIAFSVALPSGWSQGVSLTALVVAVAVPVLYSYLLFRRVK